jgi:hypothetical protein
VQVRVDVVALALTPPFLPALAPVCRYIDKDQLPKAYGGTSGPLGTALEEQMVADRVAANNAK